MNWFTAAFKKYTVFSGRARRKEYWMFYLFMMIFMLITCILDVLVGSYGLITGLFGLAVLLPSLSLTIRRLHDTGRSGWWCFITLVPVVGAIAFFVFTVLPGNFGDNQYGPDPKKIEL
ncbi:Inner membrane protein YhaH [Vibrio aerogenes CECT 7868]|uniref:Inner membrane protein YhaH n=1 Tax=Vibrio aerogenes CECT 7868 TaxID=1216006 RepID=A0A1M5YWD6_9VIBR|nr:DUF805 domain-containing protein [Vibrio aerogenes]SHI15853.1 Inner membrane protein YhaH [Vibrio aerogenes CECT 7868]